MSIAETMQEVITYITSLPLESALFAVFFLPFIPLPIPHELIFTPIILAIEESERLNTLYWLTVAIVLGETAWHMTLFLLVKHNLHKLTHHKSKLSPNHWFHKYGLPVFLIIPTLSFVAPYFSDAIIIIAGHFRINTFKLFPFLLGGFIIRGVIGSMIIKEVIGI